MAITKKVLASVAVFVAAFTPAVVSPTPAFAANTCGFPTQATPPSRFIRSYPNCKQCEDEEGVSISGYFYYCTYNPSNNLNDLHMYLLRVG
ncbi:hypothetical protein SAMN05421874_1652 [Nonomuraea maritima]|uniref:Uncharacterized protein n=1 Tax=Nonomuraea maritima TaxID=683260 RepID=A0A1G9SRP1_9ACTN|nr:hypothetical protein [Nonomuraea maritima]SDM38017.1 hypothetical protein SAMN05421874_1652 [Nonomuraea maritima]